MGLHTCAINTIMLDCKLAVSTARAYIKRRCKVLLEVGFMHILTVLGYWNPMGFTPEFCLIKILCSVGIGTVRDEEAIGYMEMNAK